MNRRLRPVVRLQMRGPSLVPLLRGLLSFSVRGSIAVVGGEEQSNLLVVG